MSNFANVAAIGDLPADESLVWSLREFDDNRCAVEFVRHFSSTLSIFSNTVSQIYARYDVELPERDGESLVVVPDMEAFTETWYSIPERAIKTTDYTILAGGVVGQAGVFLHMPAEGGKGKAVPLVAGLRAVTDAFAARGEEFLPVLTKGDLRAFQKKTPMLKLHRLDLTEMQDRSRFELNDIRMGIRQKLRAFLR